MLQKLVGRELRRRNLSRATLSFHVFGHVSGQDESATVLTSQERSNSAQICHHTFSDVRIPRLAFSRGYLSLCPRSLPFVCDIDAVDCIYGWRRFSSAVAEQPSEHNPCSESPCSEALQRYHMIGQLCEILEAHAWGDDTINRIQDLNPAFTFDVVVRVIRAVSSPSSALSFFKWLTTTGYEHDLVTFGAMLDVLGKAGYINDMKLLIGNIRDAGFKLDGSLYDILIRWLVHHGDGMTALSLSEKMKEEGLAWSTATYTSLLIFYMKEGKYDKAVAAFLQMVEDSVVPSSQTLSHIIRWLLEAGKLESAQKIYSSLRTLKIKPTQSMFACLMSAYAKTGDVRMLKEFGKELRDIYNYPGELFCVAFHSLQKEGKHTEADSFAKEVWPDLIVQETNIKSQCEQNFLVLSARDEDELQGQLEHLQCTDRKVNVAVVELVRLLENEGISVLEHVKVNWTTDAVCKTLKQLKSPALAWEFFKRVRSSPGYIHDPRNEVSVLLMLVKSSNFLAFQELFLDLQSMKKFSLEILNTLIKECALVRNAHAAMWVYSRFKESNLLPDEETFSLLVQAFARGQNPDKASDLCFVMQDVGLKPDVERYTAVIHSLGLAGRSDDAWSYYQRMCAVGLEPNASTYTALLNAMNVAGNTALGIKIFEEMNARGVSPTEATQGIMASIWEASGKSTEAQKLEAQRKFLFVKRREDSLQKMYELLLEALVEQERSPSLLSFT